MLMEPVFYLNGATCGSSAAGAVLAVPSSLQYLSLALPLSLLLLPIGCRA